MGKRWQSFKQVNSAKSNNIDGACAQLDRLLQGWTEFCKGQGLFEEGQWDGWMNDLPLSASWSIICWSFLNCKWSSPMGMWLGRRAPAPCTGFCSTINVSRSIIILLLQNTHILWLMGFWGFGVLGFWVFLQGWAQYHVERPEDQSNLVPIERGA